MAAYRLQELLSSVSLDDVKHYYKFAADYGLIDSAIHPFDYADTLIRLGYEPFPPREQGHFLTQTKSLVLPGITSYVYYLYMTDGLLGCYRGVVPYVTGALIYRHLSHYVEDQCPFPKAYPDDEPRLCIQFTDKNVGHFVRITGWKLLANIIALHASYPFHVLAVRTMARFVTKEGYSHSLNESWLEELGKIKAFEELFAGFGSRIIREIAFTFIAGVAFLALNKLVQFAAVDAAQADNIENSLEYLGNSIATIYTNPFRNASEIMIINKTDIPLGNPPFNEHYTSCIDCVTTLRTDKRWKTSAGWLGRGYFGPVEVINGRLVPTNTFFGPAYVPNNLNDIPFFLKYFYEPVLRNDPDTAGHRRALAGIRALFCDSATNIPMTMYGGGAGLPFRMGL